MTDVSSSKKGKGGAVLRISQNRLNSKEPFLYIYMDTKGDHCYTVYHIPRTIVILAVILYTFAICILWTG